MKINEEYTWYVRDQSSATRSCVRWKMVVVAISRVGHYSVLSANVFFREKTVRRLFLAPERETVMCL